MNGFTLPHGIIAPETGYDSWQVLIILFALAIAGSVTIWIARHYKHNPPRKKLSRYKQNALTEIVRIMGQDSGSTISHEQAYLLWRQVRKISLYYFGSSMLKASAMELISRSCNVQSTQNGEMLKHNFLLLNKAIYDPAVQIEKAVLQQALTDWLHDNNALTMDVRQ